MCSTLSDYNSNIILNDLSFYGGAVGMDLKGQQWLVKSVAFYGCDIGAIVDCKFSEHGVDFLRADTGKGFDCVFLDTTVCSSTPWYFLR